MSNEQRIQELENYLYSRMGKEEERTFLNRLENNLRMREALASYRASADAPDLVKARLKVLREKFGGPQPQGWGLLKPRWAVIWGITGLLIFLGWNIAYGYLNYTDEALAQAYYIPAESLPEQAPSLFQRADALFRNRQYQSVIRLLQEEGRESALSQEPYSRTALWNSLLAKLAAGQEEQPLRRLLRSWRADEKYPTDFREKAQKLERDLSSIYHQLLQG